MKSKKRQIYLKGEGEIRLYGQNIYPCNQVRPYEIELIRRDYVANGGWETFLSYEDPEQDILVGLLRLRKLSEETFRCF